MDRFVCVYNAEGESLVIEQLPAHQIMQINVLLEEIVAELYSLFQEPFQWFWDCPSPKLRKAWNDALLRDGPLRELSSLLKNQPLTPHSINAMRQIFVGGKPVNHFFEISLAFWVSTRLPLWIPYPISGFQGFTRINKVKSDGVNLLDFDALLDYLKSLGCLK